jgi:nickel/cobalt transporter (NicO) family protein
MTRARRLSAYLGLAVLAASASVAVAGPAAAHPLGNLSVNTYDGIIVEPDAFRVDHVEDIAEIPTVAALRAADTNDDGITSDDELTTWAQARCRAAAARIRLSLNDVDHPLHCTTASAGRRPGQAGLSVLRVESSLETATNGVTPDSRLTVVVAPVSDLGWREITVAGDRTTVSASDVPATTVSERLASYSGDLTTQPDERQAHAVLKPGGPALVTATTGGQGPAKALQRGIDGLTTSVENTVDQAGLPMMALLLVGSVLLGALHAIAPGHGKTIVGATVLAGQRNLDRRTRLRHAFALGTSVTAAHTGSVVVIGVVVLAVGGLVPAALFPTLAIISGVLVVGMGVAIARGRLGHVHGPGGHHHHDHQPHDHVHGPGGRHHHDHQPHDHVHGPGGHHHHDPVMDRHLPAPAGSAATHGHTHQLTIDPDADAPLPPAGDPQPGRIARSRLVVLGLAGGLVPSPTALLLFLATAAVGRAWLGLLSVVAFGIGMAATLTAVGLLAAVGGTRLLDLAEARGVPARMTSLAPRFAGVAIVAAGALVIARAGIELMA